MNRSVILIYGSPPGVTTSHRGRRKHRKIWMGNKEQGRAITGGDVEEVRVGVMDGRK